MIWNARLKSGLNFRHPGSNSGTYRYDAASAEKFDDLSVTVKVRKPRGSREGILTMLEHPPDTTSFKRSIFLGVDRGRYRIKALVKPLGDKRPKHLCD